MDKKYFFAVLCVLTLTCWADQTRPENPNIVLILVDDLGWQDVKCYDIGAPSPMETPKAEQQQPLSLTGQPLPAMTLPMLLHIGFLSQLP